MDLLETLAYLLWTVAVGRCVLAALPVGSIGGHGVRELPVTAAVSVCLGGSALAIAGRVASSVADPTDHATAILVSLTVVSAAIACARGFLAPAAMVPRHEPIAERPSGWIERTRVLVFALALAGGFALHGGAHEGIARHALEPGTRASWIVVHGATSAATIAALDGTLAVLRRSPGARVASMALAACVAWLSQTAAGSRALGFEMLACAVVALGGVLWLRRGDERGIALAAVTSLALICADFKHTPLALAILGSLVVASPRVAWRTAFLAAAVVVVAWSLDEWASGGRAEFRRRIPLRESPWSVLTLLLVALGSAVVARSARRERLLADLGREHLWLALSCASAIGAVAVFGNIAPYADGLHVDPSLWHALAPASVLLVVLLAALAGPREREIALR